MVIDVRVAIIILNWNGLYDTTECVNSILECNYTANNYRIIVINNGSDGEEGQDLKKLFGDRVDIIELESNQGFVKGNNIGFNFALKKYNPE